MKKKIPQVITIILILSILSERSYSANEQFRSIISGNWNSNSTWEMSTNGGSIWFAATSTPSDVSGEITIRTPNVVTVSVNASADQLTVDGGGTLSINTGVLFTLLNGTGNDFTLLPGGIVTSTGTAAFQTQGAGVAMNIRSSSSFGAALKVNTGTTTVNEQANPFIAKLFGSVTVDAGATLSAASGGYFLQAYGNVTNNGIISGTGGATFNLRGSAMVNNGSVTVQNFSMDTVSTLSGAGTFTGSAIVVSGSGNVTLLNAVTFSPSSTFTINSGGTFNPNTHIFTINSGTFVVNGGGTVLHSGEVRTQGTVALNLRGGSSFLSQLRVNTGTTTANDISTPFIGRLYGAIIVDIGATLTTGSGGYTLEAYQAVVNNGTITGTGGTNTFALRGPSLSNNGFITVPNFRMDTTSTVSGLGSYTGNAIAIGGSGKVTLGTNSTFSPGVSFTVNTGAILNPNTYFLNFTSGTFTVMVGGTVLDSGIFRTLGTVALNLRAGSNFYAPLVVNSGTTTANDISSPFVGRLYGPVTIANAATLTAGSGGYFLEAYDSVTNFGTIAATGGAVFVLRGPDLFNNAFITAQNFRMDSVSTISGPGTFTSNAISISSSGNISLVSDIKFSPIATFTINNGGTLNTNAHTFTFNSGTFFLQNSSTVSGVGLFQTQGTVFLSLQNTSSFNAPLKVNAGITTANDQVSPFTGRIYGPVTVDTGATLTVGIGGYFLEANSNVTNNGTITGGPFAVFRMLGTTLVNNGNIIIPTFNFQTGIHTLQGTGTWTGTANILNGSTVTLLSNHQMQSVNINGGGTFDITNFTLKLTASNPVTQSGTFTVANSNVEYDGTASQNISTANITYDGLRINNAAGTVLTNNVTINDTLAVILGDLDLNGKIITIPTTGYLSETPGNTVKGSAGYITTTRILNAPSALNVAGFGAVLTTSANLGSTEIRRGHTIQNGLNGGTSIARYFDITPANNTGLNAGFVFKYDDSELNGKPDAFLKLFKSTNAGAYWTLEGGVSDAANNQITITGLNSFSRWSADSISAPSLIKVVLEGFYNTTTHRLNMRDTVRAYLRNVSSPYAIIDSSKAVIDSVVFSGYFNFVNAPTGTYYIQLKHRNALETWSRSGGQFFTSGQVFGYDFTTDSAKAFGNNMKKFDTYWSLYEGDVSQNGFVDLTDVITINNAATNFISGYVVTDVNGNSTVDLADVLIAYNNSNIFVSVKRP